MLPRFMRISRYILPHRGNRTHLGRCPLLRKAYKQPTGAKAKGDVTIIIKSICTYHFQYQAPSKLDRRQHKSDSFRVFGRYMQGLRMQSSADRGIPEPCAYPLLTVAENNPDETFRRA